MSFVASPSGTSGSPDTAPILSFSLLTLDPAFDPDSRDSYTTTARLTSASYSLDGGSTWNTVTLVANRGDARTALAAPPGGSRYRWAWDLWSTPAPTGITGASQAILLRATILDAPGGNSTTVTAPTFYYRWPTPRIERIEPRDDSTDVFLDAEILVDFEHDMDAATINSTTIVVTSSIGTLTTGTVTYLSDTRQARVSFTGNLPTTTAITVTIGIGVENVFGVGLPSPVAATFTTGTTSSLADTDGDGLLNVEEALLGTDPNDDDTDNDGARDWDELFVLHTNPLDPDTDDDGVADGLDTDDPLGTPEDPLPVADVAPSTTFLVTHVGPTGTAVPLDTLVTLTFNNPVDASSFDGSNVSISGPTSPSLSLHSQPNSRTLVLEPSGLLSSASTYVVTVTAGAGALEDTSGTTVATVATSSFTTGPGTTPLFEPESYLDTLSMTQWERFPLTAPTAGGRQGMAVVIPATHKLLVAVTDVAVPGRGLPVAISRIYRNNETAAVSSGCFGNQWFFPYDRSFTVAQIDTTVDMNLDFVHRSEDGRIFNYLSNGASLTYIEDYADPPGAHETLNLWMDGGVLYLVQRERVGGRKSYYRLSHPNGTPVTSEGALAAGDIGVLTLVRDRNLNTVTIDRYPATDSDRPLRISSITDDIGRITTFTYGSGSVEKALVVSVEQFGERTWSYDYDGNGNLTDVGLPGGKTHGYTYTSSSGTYLLSSVVDGLATASMRFFYDSRGDVTQVDYGAGADAGTAVYSWADSGGLSTATQVDRNGNVLVVEHEATNTPGFLNVAAATTFTRGLHPFLSGGEPMNYRTATSTTTTAISCNA